MGMNRRRTAKGARKLDKKNKNAIFDKEIRREGFDPDFFRFILANNHVIQSTKEKTPEKRSEAYKRRIKRKIQKIYPDDWQGVWKETRSVWKERDEMDLQKGLFSYHPTQANPPNRPRKDNFWHAVHNMREYTSYINIESGRSSHPSMKMIENFLITEGHWNKSPKSSLRLQSEWDKRKRRILGQREDSYFPPIEDGLRYYEKYKEKIMLAIETGTPIYKKKNNDEKN